jgi:hypothetical protein
MVEYFCEYVIRKHTAIIMKYIYGTIEGKKQIFLTKKNAYDLILTDTI